jgi:hypothetical protein
MKPDKIIALLAMGQLLAGCEDAVVDPAALLDSPSPVKSVTLEPTQNPLTTTDPICDPANRCGNCNVNAQVGHVVFVHGYGSGSDAFAEWNGWIKPQNDCAGYNTYRVTVGNEAVEELKYYPNGCTFCDYRKQERGCTPNAYDPQCIGQCSAYYTDSKSNKPECKDYDRSKNGICGSNGYCIAANTRVGANKHLNVWSSDLANFFWNNKLTDLPDRSVTIVTHSTGGPAVADFMVRGYDGNSLYQVPTRKIKRIINIQAALGGACGVSLTLNKDDAISDLDDLQDDDINYDFRKTTYDGAVPWLHIQSTGTRDLECEGQSLAGSGSTGDTCEGAAHDGVTHAGWDNTSQRHPNGNGTFGTGKYNVTVGEVEIGYCHIDDTHPNYRKVYSRFQHVLGLPLANIGDVKNPAWSPPAWWGPVLLQADF